MEGMTGPVDLAAVPSSMFDETNDTLDCEVIVSEVGLLVG